MRVKMLRTQRHTHRRPLTDAAPLAEGETLVTLSGLGGSFSVGETASVYEAGSEYDVPEPVALDLVGANAAELVPETEST